MRVPGNPGPKKQFFWRPPECENHETHMLVCAPERYEAVRSPNDTSLASCCRKLPPDNPARCASDGSLLPFAPGAHRSNEGMHWHFNVRRSAEDGFSMANRKLATQGPLVSAPHRRRCGRPCRQAWVVATGGGRRKAPSKPNFPLLSAQRRKFQTPRLGCCAQFSTNTCVQRHLSVLCFAWCYLAPSGPLVSSMVDPHHPMGAKAYDLRAAIRRHFGIDRTPSPNSWSDC